MTVRKKSSETGAKKVMRAASGPGLSRFGGSMPMRLPAARLSKAHCKAQPSPARAFAVGEIVPAGKSKPSKSVVIASAKSRTCATPSFGEGVGPVAEAA